MTDVNIKSADSAADVPVIGEEINAILMEMKHKVLIADLGDDIYGYIPFSDFAAEKVDVYPGKMITAYVKYVDEGNQDVLLSLEKVMDFADDDKIAADNAEKPEYGYLRMAQDRDGLAEFYFAMDEDEKAEAFCKEALELKEKADAMGDDPAFKRSMAVSCKCMADMYLEKNEPEKALEALEKAVKVLEEADGYGTDYTLYASMGSIYQDMGDIEKTIENYEEAASCLVGKAQFLMSRGETPEHSFFNSLSILFTELGDLYAEKGDAESAVANYVDAKSIYDDIVADNGTVRDHFILANLIYNIGDLSEDADMVDEAAEKFAALAEENPGLAEIQEALEKAENRLKELE